MTDLEINIALAKAMGWGQNVDLLRDTHAKIIRCFDISVKAWRKFDYRDPIIFVAICKHWKLLVNHDYHWASDAGLYNELASKSNSIEKAAAFCVIAAAKRGDK
jgi:hypothetical protein